MPSDDPPDHIVLAITPSDADHATDGYLWSLYNPALDNPYTVPDTTEKIQRARAALNPDAYELAADEHWIRFDWDSVVAGDPERLTAAAANGA